MYFELKPYAYFAKDIYFIGIMINRDSAASLEGQEGKVQETLLLSHKTLEETLLPLSEVKLADAPPTQKIRIKSLDVYRGLTMLGMILVDFLNNDEEGSTWWLIHPDWNGFTPADLIFPAFLFIMGIAIPMAVSKNRPIKPRNVVRVFLLFLIGLALNIIEQLDFPTLRIPGILQRMSVCYGIVLLIHWLTEYGTNIMKRMIGAFFMVGLVILYLALMLPWSDDSIGCPRQNNLDPYCNFAGYVDRAIFSEDHILEKTDPEGVMSTFNAVFTTYVGYWFGFMLLKLKGQPQRLVKYWLTIAFICLLPVYPCSLLMPLNKRLYGITFLFLVLSASATTLSFFLFLVDIVPKTYKKSAKIIRRVTQPLTWLGMNPLAIFVIMQVTSNIVNNWISLDGDRTPYSAFYDSCFSWMTASVGTAVYSCVYAIFFTLIAGLLYRFDIFVRL